MYSVSVTTIHVDKHPTGIVADIRTVNTVQHLELKSYDDLRTFYDLLPDNSYVSVSRMDEDEIDLPPVFFKPGNDAFTANRLVDPRVFK